MLIEENLESIKGQNKNMLYKHHHGDILVYSFNFPLHTDKNNFVSKFISFSVQYSD